VPLNFTAVRMAQQYVHPETLATTTGGMPGKFALTFVVALTGMALLFVTLVKYEMASKHATFRLRALRRRLAGDDDELSLGGRSAAPQL
jgi:heme exporter protein C